MQEAIPALRPRLIVELQIPDDLLVARVTGRLIPPQSGRIYHRFEHPPKVPMRDDVTGDPLIHHSDDNAETLKDRLAIYHDMTSQLVEYYMKRGSSVCNSANSSNMDAY